MILFEDQEGECNDRQFRGYALCARFGLLTIWARLEGWTDACASLTSSS